MEKLKVLHPFVKQLQNLILMNLKLTHNLKLIAFLFSISSLPLFCQSTSPEQMVDQILSDYNAPGIPGVSVAVVKDGKFLIKKGYGTASLEYNIPVKPSTVFELGSVSKQFTAFAILLLEEKGKLGLDDDIRKFIPEFPDYGKVITIRHLLHHNSGIRDEMDLLCMAGWRNDDVITHDQIINMLCRQKEISFPPGNEYRYSNSNYSLLAEIVSRISGQSFAGFASDQIFKPLGMSHTLVYDNYEKLVGDLAGSYCPDDKGYKKNILSSSNYGSSNILSSVEDLSLWVKNFENPVICSRNLIEKMNECGTLNNGDKIEYAMGQEVIRYRGVTIINHNGALGGYRSLLSRFPEYNLSVILLSNNAAFNPKSAAIQIADIYLKDHYKDETPAPQPAATVNQNEFMCDPVLIARFVGKYELRPGYVISVTAENANLFVEAHEVPHTRLIQVSSNEFTLPAMQAKLAFAVDENGECNQINILLNDQPMTAKRTKLTDQNYVNPDDYTGDFFSRELGAVYSFVTINGQLYARHIRLGDIPMTPVNQDKFSTDKWFFKRIDFVRNELNDVTACMVSGERITNIRFEKIQ